MASSAARAVLRTESLGFTWKTPSPFIFCVHHLDDFPAGDGSLGPDPSLLRGRRIGQDFGNPSGWNMYHGRRVPGFPAHPHYGFETLTALRYGVVDHCDSLGTRGRFGAGDAQHITTGRGIQHSEMFPLIHEDKGNPMELFQIWINLPAKDKKADPVYRMYWAEDNPPRPVKHSATGSEAQVWTLIGAFPGQPAPPSPPPNSWTADPNNECAVWAISVPKGASFTLPAAKLGEAVNRHLYLFIGSATVDGERYRKDTGFELNASREVEISVSADAAEDAEFLVLQGRPIDEPLVQHGPFVTNSRTELSEVMDRFQRTEFGGWPHDSSAPTLGDGSVARFAKYHDGSVEERGWGPGEGVKGGK